MKDLSFLRADITLDPTSRDIWIDAARKWLTLALEFLAPELLEGLERRANGLKAFIVSTPTIDDAAQSRMYTRSNWGKALSNLSEHPFGTTLAIFGDGLNIYGEDDDIDTAPQLVTLSVDHLHASGNWVIFVADIATEKENLADPTYCRRWVDFVAHSLHQVNPAFGVIMNDYRGMGETTLDLALHRPQRVSIKETRTFLRGYGWVTICPPEVIEQLGGLKHLEDTRAFYRIEALDDGGAVLQSTESYSQYDDTVTRRIFEVFAPALPAGRPQRIVTAKQARLVFEDAHQRRR